MKYAAIAGEGILIFCVTDYSDVAGDVFSLQLVINEVYGVHFGFVLYQVNPIVDTRVNFLPCVINNPSASVTTESIEIRVSKSCQ